MIMCHVNTTRTTRAEIFAVLAAGLLGDGGVIYSDSEVAVAGFNLLLQHGRDIRQLWKHSNLDIWFAISQALKNLQWHLADRESQQSSGLALSA